MIMRKYLTELLGCTFEKWGRRKVLLTAPTGLGKTTFVIKVLLPYMKSSPRLEIRRKKVLILCNRRLLRDQYWYALIKEYSRYKDLRECVEIKTYQQFGEEIKDDRGNHIACDFSMIICDECHYFYADAEFNGFGTFVVLQAIFYYGIGLPIVFMTATMEEVEPLIVETLEKCKEMCRKEHLSLDSSCFEIVRHDFSYMEDFSNFECVVIPEEETLCAEIGTANGKSIIFIDDCAAAERMAKGIQAAGGLSKKDIAVLDATNLDNGGNSEVVKALVMTHLCLPKVIITTSVLDNGVSVEDPEVQNVVIITESRISFMQMLGRVRSGYTEKIRLLFLLRPADFFAQREERYQWMVNEIKRASTMNTNMNRFPLIDIAWGEDRIAKIYRKIFTPCPDKLSYFCYAEQKIRVKYGDTYFTLNAFAREKIENSYMCAGRLHMLAMKNPVEIVYEQMSWMMKDKSELMEIKSSYKESLIEKLIDDALKIQGFSNDEFVKVKEELACKYRKELFPNIVKKDASFETKKLEKILEVHGLELVKEEKNGKKFYTVRKKGEGSNEGDSDVGETEHYC